MDYVRDFHIYALGLWWMYQGLMALVDPKEHLNSQGIKPTKSSDDYSNLAPIYMLGIRDSFMGMFIVAHHYVDNLTAVLTLMVIMGFAKIGDGIVVIAAEEESTRKKAVQNLAWGVGLLGWFTFLAKN